MADFSIPDPVCPDQELIITNNSLNSISYNWDFCPGALEKSSIGTINNSVLTNISGIELIEEGGQLYGMALNRNGQLHRIHFVNGIEGNIFNVTNLGSPGGLISGFAESFDMIQIGGNWFGVIAGRSQNNLFIMNWGSSILNPPTGSATNINTLSVLNQPSDVKIVVEEGEIIALVTNYSAPPVIVNFRNSLLNTLTPSDVIVLSPIGTHTLSRGIDLIKKCNNWFGVTASDNRMISIDFGPILFDNITAGNVTNLTSQIPESIGSLNKLHLILDGGNTYLFGANFSSNFYSFKLNDDFKIISGYNTYPSLSVSLQMFNLGILKTNGNWYFATFNLGNGNLGLIEFNNHCKASPTVSTAEIPLGVSFNSSGTFPVSLTSFDALSNRHTIVKNVIVEEPPVSISFSGNCLTFVTEFTALNQSPKVMQNWTWDFGDGSPLVSGPHPAFSDIDHTFPSASTFTVNLIGTATDGCVGRAEVQVDIYNPPTPNFSLPSTSPICTNQPYLFTNTSTFDPGSNPSWQWEVNGSPVSTDQDLNYLIPSAIPQDIKLIASIPGCADDIIQTINTVEEGPLASFTFDNDCEDTSILFTNTTQGIVTGYTWDFGDTNMSTQVSGTNTYVDYGTYDVTLTATNAVGCNNVIMQPITIYSRPQPDFSLDLPPFSCSGTPSVFNDLTPSPPDSNLDSWTWSFGDADNGSSTTRNPQYVYNAAGDYDVNLSVTTNFGCEASVQKTVSILQSPSADFANSPACTNAATTFTPVSTVGASSWQWDINGSSYPSQTAIHSFTTASNYPAQLTTTGTNGCIAMLSKMINVPAAPSMNFISENNCAGQTTVFTETSSIVGDTPVSWQWEFSTLGTGTGESTEFSYPSQGSFATTLTTTYSSGCVYQISKNVSIVSPPTATFLATPQSGTPPLTVQLTNTSANIISQQWTVAGTTISTNTSTQYVFEELGDYHIDLSVMSSTGCMDTERKVVSVVVPSIDVEISSINLIPQSNGYNNVLIVLKNNSNTVVNQIEIKLDISGNAQLLETLNESVPPGALYSKMISTGFILPKDNDSYVCAEIAVEGDINEGNNRNCETFESLAVLTASPNPASDFIMLDWVAIETGDAEVCIFDSSGHKTFQNIYSSFSTNLNHLTIPLNSLNPGMYYLHFVSGDVQKSFQFVISR